MVALVVLPLIGFSISTAVLVQNQTRNADSASEAAARIRTAADLERVRGAIEQEIVPASLATVLSNAEFSKALGVTQLQTLQNLVSNLPKLRIATNAALTQLAKDGEDSGIEAQYQRQLTVVRHGLDHPAGLVGLGTAGAEANSFIASVANVENARIAEATERGADTKILLALRDVNLVAHAAQFASQEIGTYSATQVTIYGALAPSRAKWVQTWGAVTAASTAVREQASPPVAAAWNQAEQLPTVAAYNQFLTNQLALTTATSTAQLFELTVQDAVRNRAYTDVVRTALDLALAAGRAQQHTAVLSLWRITLLVATLALLTSLACYWVTRSVTRPLSTLAEQATRISEGELKDVSVHGPREVRTVARALSSSVETLRNIEAQAAAVASGELSNPVIGRALPGPLGQIVHSSLTRIVTAINERETAQQELAHRASHDALTELPNRAYALALTEKALHRAQRSSTKTALMFVDLDYFKAVNDNFGHATGDKVLQYAARTISTVVRDGDSVARLGGDEFVVLLENIGDEADVIGLAERMVHQLGTEFTVDNREIRIGGSVGVAFCRDGYVDADRLLQEADAAVYRAKKGGRGRVGIFDDRLRAQLSDRAELERAIADGLFAGEFSLYYQPVVDLRTCATIGVEALIRWNRPGRGMVSPDDFIPTAEQSTLINDIGRWVLDEGTRQLAQWQLAGVVAPGFSMAVNISGRHLASSELLADVTRCLAASGIDPDTLVIELTETVLVDDVLATSNMQALRELGVRVSIDDFGTGFTSIGQLPRLPVDSLKIDRSFVASEDPAHHELVGLIVGAAHAFGLSVIAEGIEHDFQADALRAVGVEHGQGFLYARPQQPADLIAMLRTVPVK